jgi:hypothetical protein
LQKSEKEVYFFSKFLQNKKYRFIATIKSDFLLQIGMKKTPKKISEAIYKLEKCLKNEPWRIRRSSTGEYALVPRQLFDTLPDGVCNWGC